MTSTCALDTCQRPIDDTAFVCRTCTDKLTRLLENVPSITRDLDDVIRRQVRYTNGARVRTTSERVLPFNPAGSESRQVLIGTLIYWATQVAEIRGAELPERWGHQPPKLGPWLAAHTGWLRAQSAGPEAFDELTTAITQARRTTDRPPEKRYAGPCTAVVPQYSPVDGIEVGTAPCAADLYAKETGDTVTCPNCHAEYPLADRRAWLLEQAADQLLPARELSRAVDGLGVPINRNTLDSWRRRGRLTSHGHTPDGHDLYRVGDVVTLARAAAQRRGDIAS
jgi:hypothetical protein